MFRFILLSALSAETAHPFVELRTKYGTFYRKNLILGKYDYRIRTRLESSFSNVASLHMICEGTLDNNH
jgi:hypothetical protein